MHCWARYLFLLLVAGLAFGQMLPACGQKGPLYRPEPSADAEARPETAPASGGAEQGGEGAEDLPEAPLPAAATTN
jgi:predicted small lipoprotein YifL